jgi:uncharacterized protein (DUF608 family)
MNERWKSGVPLGGVGCGEFEFFTDGRMGAFAINHNWDHSTGLEKGAFFGLWTRGPKGSVARSLRLQGGPEYEGIQGVEGARFLGLFPYGTLDCQDKALPVEVKIEGFAPLIAHDAKNSSLPVATFTVSLKNITAAPVEAAVVFAMPNLLGFGGMRDTEWKDFSTNYQRPLDTQNLAGLLYETGLDYGVDSKQNTVGQYAMVAERAEGASFSRCLLWDAEARGCGFWPRFSASGELPARGLARGAEALKPAGALSAKIALAPGERRELRFAFVWFMPHHITVHKVLKGGGPTTEVPASAAIDGDIATRWDTARPMVAGDALEARQPAEQPLALFVLDNRSSTGDWPKGYKLWARSGGEWRLLDQATLEQVDARQVKGRLALPLKGVVADAIKLETLSGDDFHFLSADEVELWAQGADGPVQLKLLPGQVVAHKVGVSETADIEDVGHYYLNFFADATELAEYVVSRLDSLKEATRSTWHKPILDSNLPWWLKLKLINVAFVMFSDTILTKDFRFAVQESPLDMGGALGTMDQRMAAHAMMSQLFPELDASELGLFAQCQREDGRITHFCGNLHEVIGDPRVGYGITDWPDLSCSWLMQVVKLYRWRGDEEFFGQMWPHIQRAMAWLKDADKDGDQVPEGGSTYDYETLPRGNFVYNASCYLGALKHAIWAADHMGDAALAATWRAQLEATQQAVIRDLWDEERGYFHKWHGPRTPERAAEERVENCFVAQLAGDWLSQLTGLGTTLPEPYPTRAIEQVIGRHQNSFFPIPPMEVLPDGKLFTAGCYVLQHEPYLGCEAIYKGFVDDGLETLRRVYLAAWEGNRSPWDQSLAYSAPSGSQGGLIRYMTCPTSYHVLPALTGCSLDLTTGTLYCAPRVPSYMKTLHVPIFLGAFSGWVDYVPGKSLKLTVREVFSERPITLRQARISDDTEAISLPESFRVAPGAVLDLSAWVKQLELGESKKVDWNLLPPADARQGYPSRDWKATWGDVTGPSGLAWGTGDAFDGDEKSRWTTNRPMTPGDWLVLDLGEKLPVARLVMDSKASPGDYARGIRLETSDKGKNWARVLELDEASCASLQQDGVLALELDKPVTTRYIRLTTLGEAGGLFWSIHELYVEGPG